MQKTEKLYYKDANLFECKAKVLSCLKESERCKIVLDRTCLFPEGGGQASDIGFMDGAEIIDVQEQDGIITHTVMKDFEAGSTVTVKADRKRRLDHCAQHTGEHLISGVAHTLFGAVNCGFHMADTYSTLDFDIMLSDEQIEQLERTVNQKVRENLRIDTETVDASGLQSKTLRKKTEGIENRADEFRIVYIDGVDSCTCCGSHCNTTGEVGIVKITAWKKYKSGVRIWFLCGERALLDYAEKQRIVDELARRFSTKQEEVEALVIKQGDDLANLKRLMKQKNIQLAEFKSRKLYDEAEEIRGTHIITIIEENADMQELNILSDSLLNCGNVLCMLFSYTANEVLYLLSCSEGVQPPMNELCKTVNAALNGKGGGRPCSAQGKAQITSRSHLEQAIGQLHDYVIKAVNN